MNRYLATLSLLLAAAGPTPGLAQSPPVPLAPPVPPVPPVAAAEPAPENLALGREIVALAFPEASRHAMMMRSVDTMMGQVRAAVRASTGLDADALAILDRYEARARAQTEVSIREASPRLFAAFARGYARLFTRDELAQIRDFVATPAGASFLQRSPEIIADPDVARANTAYMATVFAWLQPLQAELLQELRDHFARHGPRPGSGT